MHHHIVLLEDDERDAELIQRELRNNGIDAVINVAPSRRHLESLLRATKVDLVLSDSAVGDFTALDAVKMTNTLQPHSGFIIVSNHMDEKRAGQARRMGAIEWIRKSELSLLPPLVRMSLEASDVRNRHTSVPDTSSDESTLDSRRALRLVQAVTDLSKARDIDTVQRIVRSAARAINNADGATFVLREGNQCYYADEDAIAPLWKGQRFPMTSCISGWAMIHRKPVVIPDISKDARIPQDAYRPTFVKSMVMTPIREDAPIGAIGNYWATAHEATADEVALIQALANSTAVALENIELYRQLEQRVAERTQQLEETNESLREFSYFVSHDLRSPIRHIDAFADILAEESAPLPPAGKHALDSIKSAAARMNVMLEGLLKLAQLGTNAVEPAVVDMRALANSVVPNVLDQSVTPVTLTVEDMPSCNGNEVLLGQVWTNLLTNAVKFSAKRPAPTIIIGSEQRNDETVYFVRDNGVGFDSSKAGHLFTAFYRMHSSNDFPGTGVGLAIVHRIVTRHDGRVWAESKPDEGATFCFTIGLQA